jgi:hypothetical protein
LNLHCAPGRQRIEKLRTKWAAKVSQHNLVVSGLSGFGDKATIADIS